MDMKRIRLVLLLAASLVTFYSCTKAPSGPQEEERPDLKMTLSVDVQAQTLSVGEKATIRVSIKQGGQPLDYPYDTDPFKISFTSSDTKLLSVSERGVVTALADGSTSVVVKSQKESKEYTIPFTISPDPNQQAFQNASWGWKTSAEGIISGYAQFELFKKASGEKQSISIVKYPEKNFITALDYRTGSKCTTVDVVGKDKGALAAINGSYFNTTTLVSATTLLWQGSIVTTSSSSEARDRSTGAVGFTKSGGLDIFSYATTQPNTWNATYTSCVASGPLLINDGEIQYFPELDFNTARHPRSVIGITEDRTIVMMVVDGRFTGNAAGMSIPELAKVSSWLGLKYAINLDGGGSSTLWTSDRGTINYPCDNKKWDHAGLRSDPTIIYVTKK